MGYYSQPNGGDRYYDNKMKSVKSWDKSSGGTLYARYTLMKVTFLRTFKYTSGQNNGVSDDYGANDDRLRTEVNEGKPTTVYFGSRNGYASGFNTSELSQCGYLDAKVTVRFRMKELDDCYQEVAVQNWDGSRWSIWSHYDYLEHTKDETNGNWTWQTFTSSSIRIGWIKDELRVRFHAHGNDNDRWLFDEVEITIEMVK
jgi:hypothetical protein